MAKTSKKALNRKRIKSRVRAKVTGSEARPRLSVFRSNVNIYAQLIDDSRGVTVASASSLEKGLADDGSPRVVIGRRVGKRLAERALEAGIDTAVFDRNGFRYHGRVKAVAEGAREGGLKF
jgi:large subunit ribosomal protein L18